MPNKSSDKKYNTRGQKKHRKEDSDSSEDEDNILLYIDDDDDDEFESDSDSDSDYVPKSHKKKIAKEESESESEDYESDDEDDDEDNVEEEDGSIIDPRELRKTIATLFPSNYINEKVKDDEKKTKKKKQKATTKKLKKKRKKVKQRKEESESEEESEFSDEEEYEEYYDDDEDDIQVQDFNLIFSALAGGGNNQEEIQDKRAIKEDRDEECNSDDEKNFMRENYETIPIPANILTKAMKKKQKEKDKKKRNISEKSDVSETADAETEYKSLIELKKYLSVQLEKNPKNKILLNAVDECRESIRKLVKKSRLKNAKKYYKMVNGEDEKKTGEIEYFKKQLSNKEQLRVIKELKEINEHISIKKPYRLTLLDSNIPAKFKATVMQKVNMLRSMEAGDPEYFKLKTWVDGFMRIPFGVQKNLSVHISDGIETCSDFMEQAKKTLDDCVYGLDNAKMQIMQMIGQWITNPEALGSAIAIQGPPGTGKTSLVKEGISKILGREFAFIALGGTGDASSLEGHGYTYEGSMWGRIVQILMDSKCMNPVIYFDELDKVSDTPRGEEIIGILTHLTDTSQNSQFHDKYFSEIHFDLSKCLFIFSYNDESRINPILRDRMYRIVTKGYEKKEKKIIARDFLLPKIRQQVAFNEEDITIPDETLEEIISNDSITKGEEGVRNLKRCLETIHTKLNMFRLMKPEKNIFAKELDLTVTFPVTVNKDHVKKLIKYEPISQSLLALYV
tara:strand:+ start:45596 stop:47797 length:2202 start_codon:yes stop_codon:yes gene_type:complete